MRSYKSLKSAIRCFHPRETDFIVYDSTQSYCCQKAALLNTLLNVINETLSKGHKNHPASASNTNPPKGG